MCFSKIHLQAVSGFDFLIMSVWLCCSMTVNRYLRGIGIHRVNLPLSCRILALTCFCGSSVLVVILLAVGKCNASWQSFWTLLTGIVGMQTNSGIDYAIPTEILD